MFERGRGYVNGDVPESSSGQTKYGIDSSPAPGKLGGLTLIRDKNFQTGIVGSLAIHIVLLFLLAWAYGMNALHHWERHMQKMSTEPVMEREKEVTLLFPEQILPTEPPPPPPPEPEMKQYIRTTQNTAAEKAPANARFASDRNTVAKSKQGPVADGIVDMPTMAGISKQTSELADRDFRDGNLKDDAVNRTASQEQPSNQETAASSPMTEAPMPPTALPGEPAPPQTTLQMLPPPSPPAPESVVVAKAEAASNSLPKMLEEIPDEEGDAPRLQVKPESLPEEKPKVQIREPKEMVESPPPGVTTPQSQPRPVPQMKDPVVKVAGKADKDAFSPHTRTSAMRGKISNHGDENAVDAEATPLGVYMRQVTGAVEKKWHIYRLLRKDAVTYGSLKVRFYVTPNGGVEDLKIISDPRDADPRLTDFTLRAIKDADIPPIPAGLLPMLDRERVKIEYDVLIY